MTEDVKAFFEGVKALAQKHGVKAYGISVSTETGPSTAAFSTHLWYGFVGKTEQHRVRCYDALADSMLSAVDAASEKEPPPVMLSAAAQRKN